MSKPKEFFDFGFPEQTTFLKDGLRKKTTLEHWALLECSKVNGLFTQQDPERNRLAANYEAENLHMAFEQSSNMSDWKKYLQAHPPSPEALAVLVILGLEQHKTEIGTKGGKSKGAINRKIIDDAIANRGDKTPKVVKMELKESDISMSTINKRTAGRLPKKTKT